MGSTDSCACSCEIDDHYIRDNIPRRNRPISPTTNTQNTDTHKEKKSLTNTKPTFASKPKDTAFITRKSSIKEKQKLLPTPIVDTNKGNLDLQFKATFMERYELSMSISDDSNYSDQEREEIERTKPAMITDMNGFLSPPLTPKRHLVRVNSKDKWKNEDMDDLAHEMKQQLQALNSNNTTSTKSHLFRQKSRDKWTDDCITAEKKEMTKHMVHLVHTSIEIDSQ